MSRIIKKRIIFIAIIGVLLAIMVCFYMALVEWKKAIQDNDKYVNYICRDYHLVSLKDGEPVGENLVDVDGHEYIFRYYVLPDVSDEEFVGAWACWRAILAKGKNMVLQNAEENLDVLSDWSMNRWSLYYYDSSDTRNPSQGDIATAEDYVIYEMKNGTEKDIFQQIKAMSLNTEPENTEPKVPVTYVNALKEDFKMYLRLYFEETDTIAWESEIKIFCPDEGEEVYIITIDKGCLNEGLQPKSEDILIDPSSQLYGVIYNAYLESELRYIE